jgi:hypothetical protein
VVVQTTSLLLVRVVLAVKAIAVVIAHLVDMQAVAGLVLLVLVQVRLLLVVLVGLV